MKITTIINGVQRQPATTAEPRKKLRLCEYDTLYIVKSNGMSAIRAHTIHTSVRGGGWYAWNKHRKA